MGCGGSDPAVGYDLMNDTGIEGDLHDQRGPHYWDFRAEAVFLNRDDTFNDNIEFTSLNVGNTVVLSSNQLDFDSQTGFRVMGRYDICPLAVFEFGYTGIFDYEASAQALDPGGAPGNLFSLFSRPAPGTGQFGVNPATVTLPAPLNPFPETEQALSHTISIDSDLQSAELLYRRYWLEKLPVFRSFEELDHARTTSKVTLGLLVDQQVESLQITPARNPHWTEDERAFRMSQSQGPFSKCSRRFRRAL